MEKIQKQTYFVSRQNYYYSAIKCVEIAVGGLNYAGCDMLCYRYSGEGEEYENPIEAVEAAIKIAKHWVRDCHERIDVCAGHSQGMGLEFEPATLRELRTWAIEEKEKWENFEFKFDISSELLDLCENCRK